jgi:hypothetical protein
MQKTSFICDEKRNILFNYINGEHWRHHLGDRVLHFGGRRNNIGGLGVERGVSGFWNVVCV